MGHRVGRTARIGEQGEAIIFLQPCEMDYLAELKKHGVTLKELPLPQLMDALPSDGKKNKYRKAEQWTSIEMHPAVSYMNLTLENFVAKVNPFASPLLLRLAIVLFFFPHLPEDAGLSRQVVDKSFATLVADPV